MFFLIFQLTLTRLLFRYDLLLFLWVLLNNWGFDNNFWVDRAGSLNLWNYFLFHSFIDFNFNQLLHTLLGVWKIYTFHMKKDRYEVDVKKTEHRPVKLNNHNQWNRHHLQQEANADCQNIKNYLENCDLCLICLLSQAIVNFLLAFVVFFIW